MNTLGQIRFLWKPLVFALCLAPFLKVVGDLYDITGSLSANPIEDIQDRLGIWGLRMLVATLTITPLRLWTGWNWLLRFRRMLGLFAFFYVLMHFLVWLLLDRGLLNRWLAPAPGGIAADPLWPEIVADILERPFITIGFVALLILVALAATSTAGMRRRLGRRWQKLHRLVYAAAILGTWHYWWQVKLDVSDPMIYAALFALLLGDRLRRRWVKATASANVTSKAS